MTLEDLAEKMDERFNRLDGKVDGINTTVALHTQSIASIEATKKDFHERLQKVEKWMWMCLGAGGAAGVGISKLFM